MKILAVPKYFYPKIEGSEKSAMHFVEACRAKGKRVLLEHGFEIEVFCGINGFIKKKRKFVPENVASFLFYAINLLSAGFYKDIQFHQFGFRGVKRN